MLPHKGNRNHEEALRGANIDCETPLCRLLMSNALSLSYMLTPERLCKPHTAHLVDFVSNHQQMNLKALYEPLCEWGAMKGRPQSFFHGITTTCEINLKSRYRISVYYRYSIVRAWQRVRRLKANMKIDSFNVSHLWNKSEIYLWELRKDSISISKGMKFLTIRLKIHLWIINHLWNKSEI